MAQVRILSVQSAELMMSVGHTWQSRVRLNVLSVGYLILFHADCMEEY